MKCEHCEMFRGDFFGELGDVVPGEVTVCFFSLLTEEHVALCDQCHREVMKETRGNAEGYLVRLSDEEFTVYVVMES